MKKKIFKAISWVLLALVVTALFFYLRFEPTANPVWGLNYSTKQAEYFGLDPQDTFRQILDDLNPEKVRLTAYWEIIEPERGEFNFSEIDSLLRETDSRGVSVILVLGHKQPRWPECHHPQWYEALTGEEKPKAVLQMLHEAMMHFKSFESITAWQIENEPFFPYGPDCPAVSRSLMTEELRLVKSLDPRPLIITDSGEKGAWLPAAWAGADIFGSTMYRQVYQDKWGRYYTYPIPPAVYRIRAGILQTFSKVNRIVGVELQAEPWFSTNPFDTPWDRQLELMNPEIFREYAEYASKVGFAGNYFWGVEWWYWAKAQGHPEMWQAAKEFFESNSK